MKLIDRVIKFRAYEEADDKMYKCIVGNNDDTDDEFICPLIWTGKEWVHSDTCKIMQYTGRRDMNNKEVYEGDILFREIHWALMVVFEDGAFKVVDVDPVRNANRCVNISLSEFPLGNWKVIGNIFQTKELF